MTPKLIEIMEGEQERDLKAITEAVAKAQQKIASISPDLKADVAKEQVRAMREATMTELSARLNAIRERSQRAKAGEHLLTREAILRKARFSESASEDAVIRTALFATLSRTPTGALVRHLE